MSKDKEVEKLECRGGPYDKRFVSGMGQQFTYYGDIEPNCEIRKPTGPIEQSVLIEHVYHLRSTCNYYLYVHESLLEDFDENEQRLLR